MHLKLSVSICRLIVIFPLNEYIAYTALQQPIHLLQCQIYAIYTISLHIGLTVGYAFSVFAQRVKLLSRPNLTNWIYRNHKENV